MQVHGTAQHQDNAAADGWAWAVPKQGCAALGIGKHNWSSQSMDAEHFDVSCLGCLAFYCELLGMLTEIPTIIDPVALGYFSVALGSIIVGISVVLWCELLGMLSTLLWAASSISRPLIDLYCVCMITQRIMLYLCTLVCRVFVFIGSSHRFK